LALDDLELVLEEEEVVGGGDRDDVLRWVPGSVQDLLVEVQTVDVDLVLLALSSGAHLQKGLGLVQRLQTKDLGTRVLRL